MLFSLPTLQCALGVVSAAFGGRFPAESDVSDAELVRDALQGNRVSQGALYRRHAPLICRRATRLLSRSCEAEDVLQDSFVEAFRDLHQLQDPELFSHWLMRIATHQIHRRFRKRRLLERLGFLSQKDATLELLVDSAASPELRAQCGQLDRALQTLPADERIAWSLRHVEGCQLTEIESLTEASLATVKRRLARAQKRIQSHFEFELPEDEAVEIVPTKTAAEERSDCYEEVGS